MNKVLTSHKSDIWKTPKWLYHKFVTRGYFDPCPINPEFDGLKIEWQWSNFVNPPYSEIAKWVDKAIEEHQKGKKVVLLIPARTDTKYFYKIFEYGAYFYFIKGRLKFSEKGAAPFPSVLIELNGKDSKMTYMRNEKIKRNPQENQIAFLD